MQKRLTLLTCIMLTHLCCSLLVANEVDLDLSAEGFERSLITEDGVVLSRINNLQEGGVAYIDDRRLTSLSVERLSDTEWKVNTVLDNEEPVGLFLQGSVASSNWLTIEFNDKKSDPPGAAQSDNFDPYNIPFDTPYLYTEDVLHVLQPGRAYPFLWSFGSSSAVIELLITAKPIPEPLPGDANLDGKVAFDDFLALAQNFTGDPFTQARGWTTGDFDQDGSVVFSDFLILSENFGQEQIVTSPVSAVPEPTGVGSLLVGCLLCFQAFRGRKRCES